ncbi:hypothetical protein INT47_006180 [Mucor saturninus]|uniref:Uncharacterized protein n=1 Tax=Mucor saturninus TaxID=64648 RepID=A0A8H7RCA7_9FUNG|nr:hypothetical protein INT47_006180 [Mucor saturninus]
MTREVHRRAVRTERMDTYETDWTVKQPNLSDDRNSHHSYRAHYRVNNSTFVWLVNRLSRSLVKFYGIIDLAHDWTSQYSKSVFPDARWSEFEKLSYPIYNLTQESNEIYINVMRILKSEDQKPDHERQPEREALIYLSEKKLEYRKKKLDCGELQIIEAGVRAHIFHEKYVFR